MLCRVGLVSASAYVSLFLGRAILQLASHPARSKRIQPDKTSQHTNKEPHQIAAFKASESPARRSSYVLLPSAVTRRIPVLNVGTAHLLSQARRLPTSLRVQQQSGR